MDEYIKISDRSIQELREFILEHNKKCPDKKVAMVERCYEDGMKGWKVCYEGCDLSSEEPVEEVADEELDDEMKDEEIEESLEKALD